MARRFISREHLMVPRVHHMKAADSKWYVPSRLFTLLLAILCRLNCDGVLIAFPTHPLYSSNVLSLLADCSPPRTLSFQMPTPSSPWRWSSLRKCITLISHLHPAPSVLISWRTHGVPCSLSDLRLFPCNHSFALPNLMTLKMQKLHGITWRARVVSRRQRGTGLPFTRVVQGMRGRAQLKMVPRTTSRWQVWIRHMWINSRV